VDLHRERIGRVAVDLQGGGQPIPGRVVHRAKVEAAAVGDHRLQRGVAGVAGAGDPVQGGGAEAAVLGDLERLQPQQRTSRAACQLSHLSRAQCLAGGRIALVDEQHLGPGGGQQPGRVSLRIGAAPVFEDSVFAGVASQLSGQQLDRQLVGDRGGDVRPLPGIGAF
jgi:hypothetical protein